MGTRKIAVIMAAFNEEKVIFRAIESILNQTYRDFEFIIINDGSTDGTERVLRNYQNKDKRISLISKDNSSLADSLNIGIKSSRAEYIARIDADDIADKNRLSIQVEYLDSHPEIAMVGSWCYLIDLQSKRRIECKPVTLHKEIIKCLQKDNPFIHSSVTMRRSVIEKVGHYNLVQGMEDYDLWIRIARHYKVANIPMFLVTRYENRNLYTKFYYKGLNRYDIYSRRLKFQWKAIKSFGVYPETPWYVLKTLISIAIYSLSWRK